MSRRREGNAWLSIEHGRDRAEPAPRVLDRVAAGDLEALANLYESHGPRAYRLACRITGSIADAQDVVQDLFIGLPEALESYRGDGPFTAWFRTCTARQALLHLRKRSRRREVALEPDYIGSAASRPLDRIELEGALDRLPEALRIVVVLRDVEGFTHEDVARLLSISPTASRMRLMRARKQLRKLVAPLGGEGS